MIKPNNPKVKEKSDEFTISIQNKYLVEKIMETKS